MKYPILAALLLASTASFAGSQEVDDLQKNTSMVRLYPAVEQLVNKADTLAAEGKFNEALEIYADAQMRPNELVPVEVKPPAQPRYVGVLEFCLRRIAAWPPEGRAAARRHADPAAGLAFRAAQASRDPQALADVALRYPHSSFADDALALLGNLHLESGRAIEAASAFERLLTLPDSGIPRPVVLARLGEAFARAGRSDSLDALIRRAERESPSEKMILGDREAGLVDTLKRISRSAPQIIPPSLAPPSWEMMQGNPTGVRVADAAEFGLRQWTAKLEEARYQADDDPWGGGWAESRPDSSYRPVMPVVSDGIAYFHTEYLVQAWNLYASSSEPLWTHRVQVPSGQLLFEDRLVHSTSVSDGRVFANLITWLGQNEMQSSYIRVKYPFPKRALFALDAYTGRLLWRVGGMSSAEKFEDGLSFSSAPTPAGGFLYAGAIRQQHPTDPFEHYVVCLDPSSGRLLWSTFVASGGTEINLFGNSTRESVGSPVSVDGDSVYYGTNHGAFAALDRTTGRLRWASKYVQLPVRPTRRTEVQRGSLHWLPSPPVIARGQVIFTPTDSNWLYALDVATGEPAWWRRRGENRTIAGCDGTYLLLSGDGGVEWLDVTRGGKTAGKYTPSGQAVTGRPAVTQDGVYLPTREGLYSLKLESGPESASYMGPWRGTSVDGGHVVVAEGAIVVAGHRTVEGFLSRGAVDASVEAELKKNPDRPDFMYRAALRLLQSGKDDRAMDLLSRVIDLVTGSPRPADNRLERAARKRLFSVSKTAGLTALTSGKPAEAAAAFQRAAKAAPDISSTVEAASLLAEAAEARNDHSAAIGEYQKLLKEAGDELVGHARVFDLARAAIAKVLVAGGREPYEPFEVEAGLRLKMAQAEGSPTALMDVYRSYPNSIAAERALISAAELHSKAGKPDDAAATLRMFLREFPGSGRTLDAQAQLVLELEKRSRFGSAGAVLRRMVASGDKWELTIDGKKVRVSEFVDTRLSRAEYKRKDEAAPEPRLTPPLKLAFSHTERDYPLGAAVMKPEGPALKSGADLLFLNFGTGVKGLDVAAGKQAWKLPTEHPVRAAFIQEEGLLLASESSITRLAPSTGSVEWKHSPGTTMKGFTRAGSMICYLTTNPRAAGTGTLVALDPVSGVVAWSQSFTGVPVSSLIPTDDHVAVVTQTPSQIVVFDNETGRAMPPAAVTVKGSGVRLVSGQRGMIVLHSDEGGLYAFELPSGARKWWDDLKGWNVSVMTASSAGLFVGGTERGRPSAMLLDLRSGKRRGVAEDLDGVPAPPVSMNERTASFAVRRGDESFGARAVDLADSRLKTLWVADGRRDELQSVPLLAGSHAAVLGFSATPERKFDWSVEVLDSTGRRLQNIRDGSPLERPPSIAVANVGLILLVDNKVEVYR